jgi:rRNA maturation endonuclease Nob1
MSFCTECGQRLEAGDKFCPNCGQRVDDSEISAQKSPPSEKVSVPSKKPKERISRLAEVPSHVRIAPIYGDTFDPDVHCFNCGAKRGNSKNCQTCGEA